MQRHWTTLVSLVRVMRPPLALAAVSNVWLVVLWRHLVEEAGPARSLGLAEALGLGAGAAIGLYVFGVCLNDVLDLRRDRLFAPHRPIPSRQLTVTHATVMGLMGLLVGLFCAVALGELSTLAALVCATLVVGYNTVGKFLPAIGLLLFGLIRLTLMAIGGPGLGFWWPGWLAMTHVIFVMALVHRLQRKRPYLAPQELWIVTAGWAFITLGLIVWMSERGELAPAGMPLLWFGPTLAGVVGLLAIAGALKWRPSDGWAAGAIWRGGMAWLIVYDGSWFIASGQWRAAGVFGGLLLAMLTALHGERWLRTTTDRSEMYRVDRSTG